MDQRVESFLADVLALAGENPDAIREGVRVALADCEALFRVREPNKRMRDKAALACRALCRARVTEELQGAQGNGDSGAPEVLTSIGSQHAPSPRRQPHLRQELPMSIPAQAHA
jgi:hypothetical protein